MQPSSSPPNDAYGPTPQDERRPEPNTPPQTLDANTALDALAYAQGNPSLAAERLNLDSADTLLALISLDETVHPRAQAVLRFMQQAKLLGAIQHVENELLEALPNLEPKELAKTYTAMVLAAELYTRTSAPAASSPTTNTQVNVTQNILRMVPPEVRQAIRALTAPAAEPNLDDEGVA